MHELAVKHSRLEEYLANYDRIQDGGAKVEYPLTGGAVWGAKRWVTRYVDYTSKYGLRFLLNDGSWGVYFNDSTKALHLPAGDDFVYVERGKTVAGGEVNKEPVSSFTVANYNYTKELKNKVILVQHFRRTFLD